MLSHWLGIGGELLNFLGALVLALDIFLRSRERRREKSLSKIGDFARKNSLDRTTYKGSMVSGADFPQDVIDNRATAIAYIGTALLATGFLLLIAHHSLELQSYERRGPEIKDAHGATSVGKSDTNR